MRKISHNASKKNGHSPNSNNLTPPLYSKLK
jgi:hypothetical protein